MLVCHEAVLVAAATAILRRVLILTDGLLPALAPLLVSSRRRQAIYRSSERLARRRQYPSGRLACFLARREQIPRAVTHQCPVPLQRAQTCSQCSRERILW